MAEDSDDLKSLCIILNTTAKLAISTRLSIIFDSDTDYEESMVAIKDQLMTQLSKSAVDSFYDDSSTKPKPLNSLPLHGLLMLALVHQDISKYLTSVEKSSMVSLNEVLMDLFCQHQDIHFVAVSALNTVQNAVIHALEGIGLDKIEVEKKFEVVHETLKREETKENEVLENFWFTLENDEMFIAAFLKQLRTFIVEMEVQEDEMSETLRKYWVILKSIEAQESGDVNSFVKLRPTLQGHLAALLMCKFCNKTITTPRTLPCLHSFCLDCLKAHVDTNQKSVVCPTCGTRISSPDKQTVEHFPCSFVIDALLKTWQKLTDGQREELECAICVYPATILCIHNGKLYCKDHSGPMYQAEDMLLIPAPDIMNEKTMTNLLHGYCPQHNLVVQHFCSNCQVPVCGNSSCVTWHAQHSDLKSLDDIRKEQKRQIEHLSVSILKKREKVDEKIHRAEQNQVHVADLQENIRQSIQKYFDDISEQIESKRKEFLRDLDKAAELCWHQDEHSRQALGLWKERESKFAENIGFTNEGASEDTLALNNDCAVIDQHSLQAPVTNMNTIKSSMLDLLSDTAGGTTLAEPKAIRYPEGHLRTLLQQCNNLTSHISALTTGRGWEPVVKTPNTWYFLANRNSLYTLKKGLLTGCSVQMYDLKDLSSPPVTVCETGTHDFQALALNAKGDLIIPEETQNNFELSSWRMKKSVNLTVHTINKERFSVGALECLNTYTRVNLKSAITNCGETTKLYLSDEQCVCELDAQFQVQRKFDFYTVSILIADFAPEPERDLLLMTDSGNHHLMIFNCRHQQMVTVGGEGATPGSFSYPSGICVDAFGHVFVADAGNSRVQIFDLAGKFLKMIPYPQSLRDFVVAPSVQPQGKVLLQTSMDYLYLLDLRSPTVWRLRYL